MRPTWPGRRRARVDTGVRAVRAQRQVTFNAVFAAKLDALPQQGTTRSSAPRGRLDQSTPGRGACTEQLDRPCLIRLDGFRSALVRWAVDEWSGMKVLEGLSGGVEPGSSVPLAELGLPVIGTNGVLLVFWKST